MQENYKLECSSQFLRESLIFLIMRRKYINLMKHNVEPKGECYNEEWIPDKEQEEGLKHFVEHWDIHVVSKY